MSQPKDRMFLGSLVQETGRVEVYEVEGDDGKPDPAQGFLTIAIGPNGQRAALFNVKAFLENASLDHATGIIRLWVREAMSTSAKLIDYPCHHMSNGKLFAVKNYNMGKMSDADNVGFALNLHLFDYDWTHCCVVHDYRGRRVIFEVERDEWAANGVLDAQGCEVQVFLQVPVSSGRPFSEAVHMGANAYWVTRVDSYMNRKASK